MVVDFFIFANRNKILPPVRFFSLISNFEVHYVNSQENFKFERDIDFYGLIFQIQDQRLKKRTGDKMKFFLIYGNSMHFSLTEPFKVIIRSSKNLYNALNLVIVCENCINTLNEEGIFANLKALDKFITSKTLFFRINDPKLQFD